MHISFQLTKDDLQEALGKHGGLGMKVRSAVGFFMVAMTVLFLFLKQASWGAIVPGAIGCLFICLPRLQTRQAIKNGGRILDPVETTISAVGIESANSVATTNLSWGAFIRDVETKNLFLVYPSRQMLHIYPKRAFAPEEIETFRGMLEEHLGAATKAYRRRLSPTLVWLIVFTVLTIVFLMARAKPRNPRLPAPVPQGEPASEQDGPHS